MTKVYTVPETIEHTGTLPTTINADGKALLDYRLYGNTDGVGDKTVNYFDAEISVGTIDNTNGADDDTTNVRLRSGFLSTILSAGVYTINASGIDEVVIYKYDAEKNFIGVETSPSYWGNLPRSFTLSTATFVRFVFRHSDDRRCYVNDISSIMLTEGTTPPETFVPFGYKVDISTEKPIIYGFHINPNDSNSYTAVTYLEDAIGKTPAAMGSTAFSYGDWADTFFMPRPCMLKYDGTVDYYLNPNDYSQKADGTPSDYNNLAYGGNAMMEFPLIWYKFVQGVESGEGYFYCSNRKVDDSYKCFSNMDCDGNIIEHFYMPIYNGCTYDGKMRSISGLQLSPWSTTAYSSSSTYAVGSKVNYNDRMWECKTAVETAEAFDSAKWEQFAFNGNTTATEEITQATANNTTVKVEWYTDVLCDRQLINALLVLLSKSLDTQGSFGRGIDSGGQTAKEAYVTGSLNDKGLFYGSTANGNTAVKVFGMENWWGLLWRRTAGLVGAADNIYKYKMTYSTADGSTANGYNTDGTGYLSVENKPTTNSYVKKMQYGLWGCLPIETGSYSTQYFNDHYQGGNAYAIFGGNANLGAYDGAFYVAMAYGVMNRYWYVSSSLSCKPCGTGNLSKNLENATVTPIYIGSDPLWAVNDRTDYTDYQKQKVVRAIKKYVLTGGENWITQSSSSTPLENRYFRLPIAPLNYLSTTTNICSHFNKKDISLSNSIVGYRFYHTSTLNADTLNIRPQNVETTTVSDFKTWLAEQYAAGTPVTIWVALQTAEEIDPPIALPALPTFGNTGTLLDYDGTPAPSEMYIKYHSRREDRAIKKYHISKNLYDGAVEQGGWSAMPVPGGSAEKYDIDIRCRIDKIVPLDSTTKYRATVFPNTLKIACFYFDEQRNVIGDTSWSEDNSNEIPIGSYSVVCTIKNQEGTAIVPSDIQGIMITEGTAIPTEFDPYGKWWEDCALRVLEVRTDTFTTLPATINADRKVLLNYRIYGNTGGVGDEVDITGLSAPLCGIDTYTDSLVLSTGIHTRRIKKLVLDGTEAIGGESEYNRFGFIVSDMREGMVRLTKLFCTHYQNVSDGRPLANVPDNSIYTGGGAASHKIYIKTTDYTTVNDFKSYLAAQYAAGTPVTVWYVLEEPEVSTITIPSGLTGTIEGYLIQDGTPTPEAPIYPTANGVKQADDTYSIKYSYKLDMGVKSTNIFNADIVRGSIRSKDGENIDNTTTRLSRLRSEFEDYMLPAGTYTISAHGVDEVSTRAYDSSKGYVYEASVADEWQKLPFTFTINNDYYMRFVFRRDDDSQIGVDDISNVMLNTTTSIYIGDEPLEKDEYVDYVEQKVYRRTVNRFDISAQTLIDATGTGTMRTGVYLGFLAVGQYTLTFDAPHNYSLFITRKNGNTYTFQDVKKSQLPFTFLVNSGDEIIIRLSNTQTFEQQQFTNICVTPGTTPPETFAPYYQPTDPPVPLPALPMFSNADTVLDYDGTPAPSFVEVTYKGWFKHS